MDTPFGRLCLSSSFVVLCRFRGSRSFRRGRPDDNVYGNIHTCVLVELSFYEISYSGDPGSDPEVGYHKIFVLRPFLRRRSDDVDEFAAGACRNSGLCTSC